jgi:hypothetical protein
MSLLGGESWDTYGLASHIEDYWTEDRAEPTSQIVAGAGRCGSAAYFANQVETGPSIGVDTTASGGYAAWAYHPVNSGATLLEVTDATGLRHIFLRHTANGGIQVWRGPNPTLGVLLGSTPAALININRYQHIGIDFVIGSGTSGSVTIYVDEVPWLVLTGINTNGTGPFQSPGPWAMFSWNTRGYLDDMYWGDNSGAAPWNAFFGDDRVEGQVALTDAVGGGGFYREWTPSTGTDHGALLDEIPPNDDVDYVEGNAAGLREVVKFPNITLAAGLVHGVQLMPNCIKTLSGDRRLAPLVRSGGADALGTSKGLQQTSYKYNPAQMFQVDPTTSIAWTAATTNAMQGGVQITV